MDLAEFKQIQSQYFQASQALVKTDINLLKEKLEDIDDSYAVLRALSSLDFLTIKFEIESLFDKIIYLSITGNPTQILWARKIIKNVDRDFLTAKIEHSIKTILDNDTLDHKLDDYYYRNIVDIYHELGLDDKQRKFIEEYCKYSINTDIREIYDDYMS